MKYAKDLHRKGELNKVTEMEKLAKHLIKGKDMGIAFVTEGYEGFDAYCVIPNSPKYTKNEGFVVYDESLNKPIFINE